MLVALAGGCAGTQPARLSVRAGLPGQGALPEVWCDVSATRRSDNGLPLLRVLVESPCTTNPKLVLFAFDEQKTILERAFARRLQPRQPSPIEVELADVPPPGTEVTVFVWTRCQDGERQQGQDTCQ